MLRHQLDGPVIIASRKYEDSRGFFREVFKNSELESQLEQNIAFPQLNLSQSKKGVIRGIHFSRNPHAQAKFVTCISGSIVDVVVDLRPNSSTYLDHMKVELSQDNCLGVFVPVGFGHGFHALEDETSVVYLVSKEYNPDFESVIYPLSSKIGIEWGNGPFTISDKDRDANDL